MDATISKRHGYLHDERWHSKLLAGNMDCPHWVCGHIEQSGDCLVLHRNGRVVRPALYVLKCLGLLASRFQTALLRENGVTHEFWGSSDLRGAGGVPHDVGGDCQRGLMAMRRIRDCVRPRDEGIPLESNTARDDSRLLHIGVTGNDAVHTSTTGIRNTLVRQPDSLVVANGKQVPMMACHPYGRAHLSMGQMANPTQRKKSVIAIANMRATFC